MSHNNHNNNGINNNNSNLTLIEMILSNIEPLSLRTGYYIRKRILHKGYEILVKSKGQYIHISYIETLN